MSKEHIVALNKRTSVEQYKKELEQAGIKYDPMKRFKRILKVWINDRSELPTQDRIAVVSEADQEVESDTIPKPEMTDLYNQDTVILQHAPRTASKSSGFDNFFGKIFSSIINFFKKILGIEDDQQAVEMPPSDRKSQEQKIQFDQQNPSNSDNWGLGRIGRRENDFNGNFPYRSSYLYSKTGLGVDVYVVDSGVDDHPELQDRLHQLYGRDGDQNGHGTHVATTVAGKKYGVAKQATVHAVRVLGSNGSGSFRTIVEGLDAVLDHHLQKGEKTPSVVNMSLGGQGSKNSPIASAVDELIDNGVIVVVAAGNDNYDLGRQIDYVPAEVEPAITVGATTIIDSRAKFSNYGEIVDIWAPGHNIVAGYPNNRIAALSGTSMASPQVAGVVALMLEGTYKNINRTEAKHVRDQLIQFSTEGKIHWDNPQQSKSPNRMVYMGNTR